MDEFKERQRTVWALGDYPSIADLIGEVGEYLVERSGVGDGMDVLDVACGTGNVSLPAARTGARVTAIDLVPELLADGRAKAESEELEIEWLEGDAEQLPFADGSFDRVLSTFGHMFAPRHRDAANEMWRVAREGGLIGICTWTPEGTAGDLFRTTAQYMPPPPDYAMPPLLWGTEEHVRAMFPAAKSLEFERRDVIIEWDSLEGFAEYFIGRFPPLVAAKAALGERFEELRRALLAIWEERNAADDGRLRFEQEYLVSIVRV